MKKLNMKKNLMKVVVNLVIMKHIPLFKSKETERICQPFRLKFVQW